MTLLTVWNIISKQWISVYFSNFFLVLFITVFLSFGCWDEDTSLFAGQIKEIVILILKMSQSSQVASSVNSDLYL